MNGDRPVHRSPRRPQPKHVRVKPRYDRLGAAATALGVTVVAFLGGAGVVSTSSPAAANAESSDVVFTAAVGHQIHSLANRPARGKSTAGAGESASQGATSDDREATSSSEQSPSAADSSSSSSATASSTLTSEPSSSPSSEPTTDATGAEADIALPGDTGSGRRVVFDMSKQRTWLVGKNDQVIRTFLVSGSITDNLKAGSYSVYSRSRHAVGIDDSGTMEYFVRFTRGENAAIGFHSIPRKNGKPLQTRAQLGTPLSHGCIRQARPDAIKMWNFAKIGTKVVVID